MIEIKGEIVSMYPDAISRKNILVVASDENFPQELESLTEKPLSIVFKKFRKKRSLNANAYAWVLMQEMANVLRSTKEEVYNSMLGRYGQECRDEEGNAIFITAKECIDFTRRTDIHVKYIRNREHNGETYIDYILLRGSSQFDIREMAIFIDGIISECNDLNIETITPNELERMKSLWQPKEL